MTTTAEPQHYLDYGLTITGERRAMKLAASLVMDSIRFSVEPMPDDTWGFRFKEEAIRTVNNSLRILKITAYPKFGGP